MMKSVLKIMGICLFLLAFSIQAEAQSKKVWLYQADHYYGLSNYASAAHYYQMVLDDSLAFTKGVLPYEVMLTSQKLARLKVDSTQVKGGIMDYVVHQLAMCYRNAADYNNAVTYFELSAKRNVYIDDYYYWGNALMRQSNYEEALKVFEEFVAKDGASDEILKRALQDMSSCDAALKMKNNDLISIQLEDTTVFNKGTASFATSFWGENRLVFTSAREGGVILDPESQDSKYLCDLYWTELDGDNWGTPSNFGRPLNTSRHEGSGSYNSENAIYFTRWSDENRNEQTIFVARELNMKFFESQRLDSAVNVPGYQSINPYVSADNQWLYFSSNRPGGKGGFDIWKVHLDEMGNPDAEPENLGDPVNTEFDERAPFFHEHTNTLFFSSDGHETMGGLDVFKSKYSNDLEKYLKPINMGAPINSNYDDSYFIINEQYQEGYFSSNRELCMDCDSTYGLCSSCYHIYSMTLPDLKFSISGYVYDVNTNEIIPGAKIEFKDASYNWDHFAIQADSNGYYEHTLVPDLELFMRASMKDYFADKAIVMTLGETESKTYTQDFYLEQIPQGEITIEGIEYDFDSANLRPESKLILDNLIDFLELNHNISIEIRSHTDQRGNDEYNLKLSDRRAQSVVDYLIEHGIDEKRLIAKGYGETEPAEVPDSEGNLVSLTAEYIANLPDRDSKEEAHQRNRRTAFKVINQE